MNQCADSVILHRFSRVFIQNAATLKAASHTPALCTVWSFCTAQVAVNGKWLKMMAKKLIVEMYRPGGQNWIPLSQACACFSSLLFPVSSPAVCFYCREACRNDWWYKILEDCIVTSVQPSDFLYITWCHTLRLLCGFVHLLHQSNVGEDWLQLLVCLESLLPCKYTWQSGGETVMTSDVTELMVAPYA